MVRTPVLDPISPGGPSSIECFQMIIVTVANRTYFFISPVLFKIPWFFFPRVSFFPLIWLHFPWFDGRSKKEKKRKKIILGTPNNNAGKKEGNHWRMSRKFSSKILCHSMSKISFFLGKMLHSFSCEYFFIWNAFQSGCPNAKWRYSIV